MDWQEQERRHAERIYGKPVEIQSAAGQARIREKHRKCMAALNQYPTIRKHVHDNEWAEDFLQRILSQRGEITKLNIDPGYPDLYLAPGLEECRLLRRGFMSKMESGLEFLRREAPRRNWKDLVGNLRKGNSVPATFEILLACALVSAFGEEHVQAYPRVSDGSAKNVEFATVISGKRLLFEATMLVDSRSDSMTTEFCIANRLPFPIRFVPPREGVDRFVRKCQEKALERDLRDPLVLCINQVSRFPGPEDGSQGVRRLVGWASSTTGCMMVAIAHFWRDCLQRVVRIPETTRRLNVQPEVLAEVERAMKLL